VRYVLGLILIASIKVETQRKATHIH